MSVKRRCPNGTRKNKTSGNCESNSQKNRKRCPNGTRKNKTSGNCEKKKSPSKKTPSKKTPSKKTPSKKTPSKKTPSKKTPSNKSPVQKSPSKKTPSNKSPVQKSPSNKSPVQKSVKEIQKIMLARVKKVTGDPRKLEDDTYIDPSDIYDLRDDLDDIIEKESNGLSEADKKTLWRFADYIEYTLREFADEHVGADEVEGLFYL
jgi:hypothetical protein